MFICRLLLTNGLFLAGQTQKPATAGMHRIKRTCVTFFCVVGIFYWLLVGGFSDNAKDVSPDNRKSNKAQLSFYDKMLDEHKDSIRSPEELQQLIKANINHEVDLASNEILNSNNHPTRRKKSTPHPHKNELNRKVKDERQKDSVKHNDFTSSPDLIKELFSQILPIIKQSEPKIGYKLKSEMNNDAQKIPQINKKFNLAQMNVNRVYGKNENINIAIHDNDENTPILSRNYLLDCLYLPDDMFETMKTSHDYFVHHIPDSYSANTYHGNGIVFIGGGKFSWLSLLSIENLRFTGTKLPIELVIPTKEEYEPQLCERILPKLNAKCLKLYEVLPDGDFQLGGYQYKSISLIASSFENVLFLDSDNIAIMNPDPLFDSQLFKDNGLILWPDFWRRITHPLYYELAGKKISDNRVRNGLDKVIPLEFLFTSKDVDNDIPFHDLEGTIPEMSTESGQILINKKSHFKTLLLSFYYNYYGPRNYYPLFSQGGNGEGDKETFYAASNFFNLPTYQVNKPVEGIGHWDNERYYGVGMVQFDPITDKLNEDNYERDLLKEIKEIDGNFHYDMLHFFDYLRNVESKPMFIHSNFPKFEPISLINDNRFFNENGVGDQWRLYKDQPNIGFDFELRQWELINKYFCSNIEPLDLQYLKSLKFSKPDLCASINERLLFLESNKLIAGTF